MLDIDAAAYHMNGPYGEYNLKFISPDGHFEVVYNSITGALVTDADNMGTYNYFGPSNGNHYGYDVMPWYKWGNTGSQGINRSWEEGFAIENARAASNLSKFLGNQTAIIQRNYYFNLLYS